MFSSAGYGSLALWLEMTVRPESCKFGGKVCKSNDQASMKTTLTRKKSLLWPHKFVLNSLKKSQVVNFFASVSAFIIEKYGLD